MNYQVSWCRSLTFIYCHSEALRGVTEICVSLRTLLWTTMHVWAEGQCSMKGKSLLSKRSNFLCMYVCSLATAYTAWASKLKFEPYSLHMIVSKCIFSFFEILLCFWVIPLFHFSQFSIYQGYQHTDDDNQWLKLKPCITRKYCVYSNFIDWIVTSSNDVISFKIWTHV